MMELHKLFFILIIIYLTSISVKAEDIDECKQGKISCDNRCIIAHCYNDTWCNDYNPYTLDKCINPGTCDAKCEFDIAKSSKAINKTFSQNISIAAKNSSISVNYDIYQNESNNSVIVGSYSLESKKKDFIWFIIKDPKRTLIKNIDKAHFSLEPFKTTNEEIVWKIYFENQSIILIKYWFEEELTKDIIQDDLNPAEHFKLEKLNIFEKAFSRLDPNSKLYLDDALIRSIRLLVILTVALIVGFSAYLYNGRNKRVKLGNLYGSDSTQKFK